MPRDLPIRSNFVCVVVLRREGEQAQTLLLRRTAKVFRDAWCQVAGRIEDGEAAWETALREVREETGLVPMELHAAGTFDMFYDARKNRLCIAPVFVAFVDAQAAVKLNHEHSEYKWVGLDRVDDYLGVPNQRDMFAHVRRHFVERQPTDWSRIDVRNEGRRE